MTSPWVTAVTCLSAVMLVMALLVGVLYALRAVSRRTGAVPSPVVPAGDASAELVAVLAAAAWAALGKAVVVRRIHVVRPAGQESWSRVGRIDILRSHRMDPKR